MLPRDVLQELLDEIATKDNKIDGPAIFYQDNLRIFIKPQKYGHSGSGFDVNKFTAKIGRQIRDSLKRAAEIDTPLYVTLLLEKALWTAFLVTVVKQEFLLVFFLSDNNPHEASGEHLANCLIYKPEIERLLEDIFR
ncbi:MAG: hypothetical protein AB4352_13580 [Hormoscilla sp.]